MAPTLGRRATGWRRAPARAARRNASSDASPLLRPRDHLRHDVAVFGEGVVDDLERRDRRRTEAERVIVETAEARLVDATRAAARRRAAQVREVARVLRPAA